MTRNGIHIKKMIKKNLLMVVALFVLFFSVDLSLAAVISNNPKPHIIILFNEQVNPSTISTTLQDGQGVSYPLQFLDNSNNESCRDLL